MHRLKLTFLAMATIAILLLQNQLFAKSKWEKIKSKHGISVYRKSDPNSKIMQFKGKGVVNQKMFLVMAVLADIPNLTKWIDRLEKAVLVKEIGDQEVILYNQIGTPWPLQSRDFILHTKVRYDVKNDWIHINGKNIIHPKYPKKSGFVRIPYLRNHWSLKPIRKGMATWVEFNVQADPGGIIPAWVSNMVSKDVPFKTITNLRRRVAQGKFSRKVLRKIEKFSKKYGLKKLYTKKYGSDYVKDDAYYEKTYNLVD